MISLFFCMQIPPFTHTLYYMATIILTGGGSAGHCAPNLALIPYLNKYFDKIYYIGSIDGIEKNLVKNAKIPYYCISCAKLQRKITFSNLSIPFKVVLGKKQAIKLLRKLKPDVVFSKGGYVAVPVVLASKKLKIPVISHESDLTIGLANKITSKFCDKVLTSFPETAKSIKNGLHVGSPLKNNLFTPIDKNKILKKFGFTNTKPIILVMGGSLGAKAINEVVLRALPTLLTDFNIIHVKGKGNLSNVRINGYFECEYLNNIEDAFKVCSIAISRAGSNTAFELLSLKIPTIFIPLPKSCSRGDQILNAEYFEKKGIAKVLLQEDLNENTLLNLVNKTFNEKHKIIKNLSNNSIQNACHKIVEILKNYIV